MRLSSYRTFHKTIQRLQLLYEATIHSYRVLFEQGRQRLKEPGGQSERVAFTLGDVTVQRPLRIVTYHARDVYPHLLRSTLLIRLVAAYEAFLVDTVAEIAQRDPTPFTKEGRTDITNDLFLKLAKEQSALDFIVKKKLRQLTSGGLDEIRKWYTASIGVDLMAAGQSLADIQEIHDRRHLYVHRSGYADEQYCRKYPTMPVEPDDLIVIDEPYFSTSMNVLQASALKVKQQVEAKFPQPPVRKYETGMVKLPPSPEHLLYLAITPRTQSGWDQFSVLDTEIDGVGKPRDVVAWMSQDGEEIRYVIGGTSHQITALRKAVHKAIKLGDVVDQKGFKIKRE